MDSTSIENKVLDLDGGEVPVWLARPFQLVSLLEMLSAYAQKFYLIGQTLENNRSALAQYSASNAQLPDDSKRVITTSLQRVVVWCREIGLNSVAAYAQNCLKTPHDQLTYKKVNKMLEGLQERLDENLGGASFKFIPFPESLLYNIPFAFGMKVTVKFTSAGYDIEEAAKCLALERYTACVMHLMRVEEVGLKAYGTSLKVMEQIKAAQADWGTVLRIANDEIKKLNAGGDPTWTTKKRAFFEETHALLHAVRVAWRNPSMHADQKYDHPRAKRIFEAVKDWMSYMADHLDESGDYTP
jgi:hypothetical protein